MLMHGKMVQIVPCIIPIAGLRMDTVHLIVVLSDKILDRHVAFNASLLFISSQSSVTLVKYDLDESDLCKSDYIISFATHTIRLLRIAYPARPDD